MSCDAALQFSLRSPPHFPFSARFANSLWSPLATRSCLALLRFCEFFFFFLGFFVAFSKICILLDLRKDLRLLQRRNAPFVGDVCINLPKTGCDPIAFRDCYSNVSDCNVCQDKHVAVA